MDPVFKNKIIGELLKSLCAIFKIALMWCLLVVPLTVLQAVEFHVGGNGKDSNPGTEAMPLRTIQRAADLAQAGDVITVHQGVYRERVDPPRGGSANECRIVYQAAPGDTVEIKGSEVIRGWEKVQPDVWRAVIPNTFFGNFNPCSDLIRGDWFSSLGRQHHTGAVYMNGDWLAEAAQQDAVFKPIGKIPLWFSHVDATNTTIVAQFKDVNPNEQNVEINVRQTVFYPDKPGRNFITVRGFTMRHAATPWAPPTAEQIGLIGTHWSKGWIIENNTISHSVCSGITLGKYGDIFDNKAGSANGYVGTINRALTNGWNKATIGSHVVRNNHISHCEQAGIVGSLGAVFSRITGNVIHDIHVRRLFSGCEQAGIKIHAAIDVEISGNHVYRTNRGLWLDWMAQGAQVTRNLFHDNASHQIDWSKNWEALQPGGEQDVFLEVNHGPILIANNLFLSPYSINMRSQGVAFVHNLIAGAMRIVEKDKRQTPWFEPHSTKMLGLHDHPIGDSRYYNNIFVRHPDLSNYDLALLPLWLDGNVYLAGARPTRREPDPVVLPAVDPVIHLSKSAAGWYLGFNKDSEWGGGRARRVVTSELLGKVQLPNQGYTNPDGSQLPIDADYFGNPRNPANPVPGPFESPRLGRLTLKVF